MTSDANPSTTEPRSRRAILAGSLTGLAGLIAGRAAAPDATRAAAGDPLLIGNTTNNAGTANTTLTTSSTGTALLVTQNGVGTALRGSAVGPGSIAGFFTAQNGTGISGVTGNGGRYGVFAQNNGAAGIGSALREAGGNNHGVVATTASNSASAIVATSTVFDGVAILASNTSGLADGFLAGSGIRVLSGGGTVANIHPATGTTFVDAAGEFAGPNGVIGASTGDINTAGVLGLGGASGSGLWGRATAGNGLFAQSLSNSAVSAESESDIGVNGFSEDDFGVRGGSVNSDGVRGEGGVNGVSGISSNSSGSGVYGDNVDGFGVAGRATGFGIGVDGRASDGEGVYGEAGTGFGVHGFSTSNAGVAGESISATGVYASSSSGMALQVSGNATVTGNLAVTGTVSKGGGSFKIDHPLDPANKFLYHSFVESPDMMNVYTGIATLDSKGEATVKVPAWFEKLNKEFRYQLTAIGPTDRILYVKSEGHPAGCLGERPSGCRRGSQAQGPEGPVSPSEGARPAGLEGHRLRRAQGYGGEAAGARVSRSSSGRSTTE